jgi:hypothetical protein
MLKIVETWRNGKFEPRRKVWEKTSNNIPHGPIAQDRLEKAAALFRMTPGEYTKAVLYRDLGIFDEPLDQRRRSWRQHKRKQQLEEERLEIEKHEDF